MRKHTRNYLNAYYPNFGPDDFFFCEVCLIKYEVENRMVDVNHIDPRGMGGSKLKDDPTNLLGCCRDHHNQCEGITQPKIQKDDQKHLHRRFEKWIIGNA